MLMFLKHSNSGWRGFKAIFVKGPIHGPHIISVGEYNVDSMGGGSLLHWSRESIHTKNATSSLQLSPCTQWYTLV